MSWAPPGPPSHGAKSVDLLNPEAVSQSGDPGGVGDPVATNVSKRQEDAAHSPDFSAPSRARALRGSRRAGGEGDQAGSPYFSNTTRNLHSFVKPSNF